MSKNFSTPEAAAKGLGRANGIINAGGTLYWESLPADDSPMRSRPVNLGVGRETGRGHLVTGYGASGTNKGWLALSAVLVRRAVLVQADGRWQIAEES